VAEAKRLDGDELGTVVVGPKVAFLRDKGGLAGQDDGCFVNSISRPGLGDDGEDSSSFSNTSKGTR
jgi:hypothetical protein